jgi:hypothetical protein
VNKSQESIERLHVELADGFKEHLNGPCEIQPEESARAKWHRRSLEQEVMFYLWVRKARQFSGLRSGGRGLCPVIAGKRASDTWTNGELVWASWREVWTREGHDAFALKEAAFTFFWGRPSGDPISEQLFRAEWPQEGEGGKKSAQPHWQVDWPLANLTHVVSGIHFGMAGWDCMREQARNDANQHCSGHWRRFVGTEDALQTWAVRTLEYSLDQTVEFFPKNWG